MVYTINQIRERVKLVADRYDIQKVRLFGSYYDGNATEESDLDFVVTYGPECRGLKRIAFILDLENGLEKSVDVINIKFPPDFLKEIDLDNEERTVYVKPEYSAS